MSAELSLVPEEVSDYERFAVDDTLDVWVMRFAASREQTVARIVVVFGIDPAVAERLVDSVPVAVKRRIEPTAALELRHALEDIGGEVQVLPTGEPPVASSPPPPPELSDVSALPLPDFDAEPPPAEPAPLPPIPSLPPPALVDAPYRSPTTPSLGGRFGRAGTKIFVRFAAALLVSLGIWASLQLFGSDEVPVFEDIDEQCEWELTQPHAEARAWVNGRGHIVTGMRDPGAAVGFVNQLYRAGATRVAVTRLQGSGLQQTSGTFVVELPATGQDAVLAAAERAVQLDGPTEPIAEHGYTEAGERYLRVVFAGPLVDPGGNPYEIEAELREATRARERGYSADE